MSQERVGRADPLPLASDPISVLSNFDLNRQGKNGGSFEGGWNGAKYDAFVKWIDANPDKLKMSRAEFDSILKERRGRAEGVPGAPKK